MAVDHSARRKNGPKPAAKSAAKAVTPSAAKPAGKPVTGGRPAAPAGVDGWTHRPSSALMPQEPAQIERYTAQLQDGAAALGLALDEVAIGRLLQYLALLNRWNKVYNLTAVRNPDQMLSHHLLDSLTLLNPLRRHLAARPEGAAPLRLLDVGSGGGLPGVVVASLCPQIQVTCVDTVAKKATFIRQAGAELRLPNLQSVHARVETLPLQYDVITARAFASLPDIVGLTRDRLVAGGVWAAMKGVHPTEELAALPSDIDVFHVEPLRVPGLDAERCLIWMRPRAA